MNIGESHTYLLNIRSRYADWLIKLSLTMFICVQESQLQPDRQTAWKRVRKSLASQTCVSVYVLRYMHMYVICIQTCTGTYMYSHACVFIYMYIHIYMRLNVHLDEACASLKYESVWWHIKLCDEWSMVNGLFLLKSSHDYAISRCHFVVVYNFNYTCVYPCCARMYTRI